ncbi:MAG: diguanylate cyclase [Pseudomonadota bacterium]
MKKNLLGLLCFWVFILLVSFYWNMNSAKNNQTALTIQTARTLFDQMVVMRRWNASHNGVYVKVTDETRPNIYLKDPQRDLECGGVLLTKINPSFMTRQVSEMTNEKMAIQFHMTGLAPLRPENAPDSWEKAALELFSKGEAIEKGELFSKKDEIYFLYMKGLKAEKSCLTCHTNKSYQLNDIVGGISVKIYNPPEAKIFPIVLGHCIIGALGFFILLILGLKLTKSYETIQYQAIYDALTGIPNRRFFNERFAQEVARNNRSGNPLSVIMADIDNFKKYNDHYGHEKGDHALIQVAKAIKQTLNRSVDFCARFGGEEFIVVLPDTDKAGAIVIADLLLENVKALKIKHAYSDARDTISISIGIACKSKDLSGQDAIIKQADDALYKAKAKGKNCYHFLC